jgi:hypothetical protein
MAGVMDKILAIAEAGGRTRVFVPEWDSALYFVPLTPSRRAQIRKGINPNAVEELYVSTLMHLAQNEDGTPAFPLDPLDLVLNRARLLTSIKMDVLMRVLIEAGAEPDPRAALIESLTAPQVMQLMTTRGGADLGDVAGLTETAIAAIKALAVMPAHEIEAALEVEPNRQKNEITAAKNG